MIKQVVVRTYPHGWTNQTTRLQELLNEGYTELVTACLNGNPSNEFHKSLGGILVEQSEFEPLGIHVGTENVYFHKNLRKSLEYNSSKKI